MRLHQFSPSSLPSTPAKSPDISNGDDEGAQILDDIKAMAARLSRFLDDALGGIEAFNRRPKHPAKAGGR